MPGYVYILRNTHIQKLVKVGFTDRDPNKRAAELSANTGVPGRFEIVHSWLVADAAGIERRIHLELARYHRTGEFFELSSGKAKSTIAAALQKWGAIDSNGLSFEGKRIAQQELANAEERKRIQRHAQDVSDFEASMRSIVDEIEYRERQAGAKAYEATRQASFLSLFKSDDTPERRDATLKAINHARSSLVRDLDLPWLFSAPSRPVLMAEDKFFAVGEGRAERATAVLFENSKLAHSAGPMHYRRLPKGTIIASAKGWVFNSDCLLRNAVSGSTIDRAIAFSRKLSLEVGLKAHDGRHFSMEDNLGAYDKNRLTFYVGEIPIQKDR